MSDIEERLRAVGTEWAEATGESGPGVASLLREGADEIARLREAVDDEKAARLAIEKTNVWFLRARAAEERLAAITTSQRAEK